MDRGGIFTAVYLLTLLYTIPLHKALPCPLLVEESITIFGDSVVLPQPKRNTLLTSSCCRCRSEAQRTVNPLIHASFIRKHSLGVATSDVESRSRRCRHQRPRSTIPCSPRVPLAKARPDGPTPRGDQSPLHCWMCSEAILGQLCVARRLSEVCIGASRGRTCRSPFP